MRRWRFWACFQGENREKEATDEINRLKEARFDAKVWAPLPQHKTSGHTHVVVLCTTDELFKISGVEDWLKERGYKQ